MGWTLSQSRYHHSFRLEFCRQLTHTLLGLNHREMSGNLSGIGLRSAPRRSPRQGRWPLAAQARAALGVGGRSPGDSPDLRPLGRPPAGLERRPGATGPGLGQDRGAQAACRPRLTLVIGPSRCDPEPSPATPPSEPAPMILTLALLTACKDGAGPQETGLDSGGSIDTDVPLAESCPVTFTATAQSAAGGWPSLAGSTPGAPRPRRWWRAPTACGRSR